MTRITDYSFLFEQMFGTRKNSAMVNNIKPELFMIIQV